MPNLDQLHNTFKSNEAIVPEHYAFYLRGVVNSMLPDFMNPLSDSITENEVSGEFLEALRMVATTMHPDLKEGQTVGIDYDDVMRVLGGESIFEKDDRYSIETIGETIRTSLGEFALSKQDGKYVVTDVYDFQPTVDGGLIKTAATATKQLVNEGLYPAARTMGGYIMPEGANNTAADDALRVRIAIPNEPEVIATDYDNDIPENATSFVFEGPMTTKRKSIFDAFISTAQAGTLNDNVDLANLTDLGTERDLRVGDFKPFPMDGNDEEGRMNEAQRALLDGDE